MKNGLSAINPICFGCKNFNEMGIGCKAFEDIPEQILDGSNDHSEPLEGQDNDIVFEPIAKDADK